MIYKIQFTTQFKKDLKLIKKQGKDLSKLYDIIQKLADKIPLDTKFKDHDLRGEYAGCRECHIEPDWLLIYEYFDDILVLTLTRTGSHSELF